MRWHKNTRDHTPPPYWHLSLTFSAPSCESPPLYLQPGLRRAARGNCSSSRACHTARSYPSRARTASPRSSHIWIRRQESTFKLSERSPEVTLAVRPRPALEVWVYMLGMMKLFSLEKSKAVIFISCICKSSSGPAVDNWGYEKLL